MTVMVVIRPYGGQKVVTSPRNRGYITSLELKLDSTLWYKRASMWNGLIATLPRRKDQALTQLERNGLIPFLRERRIPNV